MRSTTWFDGAVQRRWPIRGGRSKPSSGQAQNASHKQGRSGDRSRSRKALIAITWTVLDEAANACFSQGTWHAGAARAGEKSMNLSVYTTSIPAPDDFGQVVADTVRAYPVKDAKSQ